MAADRLRGRRDGASVEMDSAPMVGCKMSAIQIGGSNHSDIENEPGVTLQKSPGKVLGGAGRLSMTISPVLWSARAVKVLADGQSLHSATNVPRSEEHTSELQSR